MRAGTDGMKILQVIFRRDTSIMKIRFMNY